MTRNIVEPRLGPANNSGGGLRQLFGLGDLVPLSVSSIGPIYSVAATGGVMAAQAGWWTLPAIAVLAVPFIVSSFVFRLLNRHFPHAGASYHWSGRVIGRAASRYQAWILILAYFTSIPPIAIPAAGYTIALVAPRYHGHEAVTFAVTLFWIAFAAVPLLLGARPTARITKVFFGIEIVSLVGFAVLGLVNLHRVGVPVHFGKPPIGGILVVAVVAATVLDGWEIDSYAAEESKRPRRDTGISGIIGAFLALGFYAVLYPLMFAETPMGLLANASDPLVQWANRLIPGQTWAMLIPVIGSTAGGLWLTTFILTRALFAMGREGLIPDAFGRTSSRGVPHVATIVVLGLTLLVTALQIMVTSLGGFFNLVLSAAGFFLLAEFFFDSITAVVFLTWRHDRVPAAERLGTAPRRLLIVAALFASAVMGCLLVAFFVYGPQAIGNGIDQTLAVLLVLGLGFTWWTARRGAARYDFHGRDAEDTGRGRPDRRRQAMVS
ncbi:APC family permease [Mycobacterium sp. SM1]|uniref:APC family permease n=1 Tax=Mycobacterium sp. SM1 TaxID=2816243 RepID=UPI001BCA94D0|nr:APC family permease [Mycobacterium sp. SM1]MBS4726912.1 APC family permease [Mycobacterium sp. SM1]